MARTFPAAAFAALVFAGCSNSPMGPSGFGSQGAVLVGAGDIAQCNLAGAEQTARLLDGISGTVFTAGDNAYPDGSAADFNNCYHPTWGRHRDRTRPVPGNHDYLTPGASAYFNYFGERAGPAGLGYYTYRVGSWLVLALNSEVDISGSSPQLAWMRGEVTGAGTRCTLAIWHKPLFASGLHGNSEHVRDAWRALYELNADVIITGHDHLYERFAPQDADGRLDAARGIRQFVVGTGGADRYTLGSRRPNSEAIGFDWGVIKLTLGDEDYRWEFVPVANAAFRDAGAGRCH